MRFFFILFFLSIINNLKAQTCGCRSSIVTLIKLVEENYAGFNDKYREDSLKYRMFKKQINNFLPKKDTFDFNCYLLLKKYTAFFKDPHLAVYFNTIEYSTEVRKLFSSNFPIYSTKIKVKRRNSFLEDYWIDDTKRYIIKVVQVNKNHFIGFVSKGDSLYWFKNQIKLKIKKNKDNSYFVKYFQRDHSSITTNLVFLENEFKLGKYARFTRVSASEDLLKPKFTFQNINKTFSYLKLPNFYLDNLKIIDSIIQYNKKAIENTKYLIIDLRNNSGGSNLGFSKLLPYIYTNPMIKQGYSILASPVNIGEYEKYARDEKLPQSIRYSYIEILKALKNKIDNLVEIVKSTEIHYDTIYENPKKIFILVNEKSASVSEQFILLAKQSKKTIIVGNPTAGSIDYNDINYDISLPCKFLNLYYPMSRSNRVVNIKLHSQIKPDIDLRIPDNNWVPFIINHFN